MFFRKVGGDDLYLFLGVRGAGHPPVCFLFLFHEKEKSFGYFSTPKSNDLSVRGTEIIIASEKKNNPSVTAIAVPPPFTQGRQGLKYIMSAASGGRKVVLL